MTSLWHHDVCMCVGLCVCIYIFIDIGRLIWQHSTATCIPNKMIPGFTTTGSSSKALDALCYQLDNGSVLGQDCWKWSNKRACQLQAGIRKVQEWLIFLHATHMVSSFPPPNLQLPPFGFRHPYNNHQYIVCFEFVCIYIMFTFSFEYLHMIATLHTLLTYVRACLCKRSVGHS